MNEAADENVLVDQRRIQAEAAVADGSRKVLEVFCNKGHRVTYVHLTTSGLIIEMCSGISWLDAVPERVRLQWTQEQIQELKERRTSTFDVLADVEFLDCSCHCTFFRLDREKVTKYALNGPNRTHVRNVVSREV